MGFQGKRGEAGWAITMLLLITLNRRRIPPDPLPPILLPVSNIPFLHPTYHSKSNRKISQAKHPRLNTYKNLIFAMDCFRNINNQSINKKKWNINFCNWHHWLKIATTENVISSQKVEKLQGQSGVETTVPVFVRMSNFSLIISKCSRLLRSDKIISFSTRNYVVPKCWIQNNENVGRSWWN